MTTTPNSAGIIPPGVHSRATSQSSVSTVTNPVAPATVGAASAQQRNAKAIRSRVYGSGTHEVNMTVTFESVLSKALRSQVEHIHGRQMNSSKSSRFSRRRGAKAEGNSNNFYGYSLLPDNDLIKTDVVTVAQNSSSQTHRLKVDQNMLLHFYEKNLTIGVLDVNSHNMTVKRNQAYGVRHHVDHPIKRAVTPPDSTKKLTEKSTSVDDDTITVDRKTTTEDMYEEDESSKTQCSQDESYSIEPPTTASTTKDDVDVDKQKTSTLALPAPKSAIDGSGGGSNTSFEPITDISGDEHDDTEVANKGSGQLAPTFTELAIAGENKSAEMPVKRSFVHETRKVMETIDDSCAFFTINLHEFFMGKTTITKRHCELETKNLEEVHVTITLDRPLLSEDLQRELNPCVVTVLTAHTMPDVPVPFDDIKKDYVPAFVSYSFFDLQEPVRTTGIQQEKTLVWEESHVYLAGTYDQERFAEFLSKPLIFEVHDRDRFVDTKGPLPSLFGEDENDNAVKNMYKNVSRSLTSNPFSSIERQWDPYGVATVDVTPLLRGTTLMNIYATVLPCERPADAENTEEGQTTKRSLPGLYVESGTELDITLSLAYPIISVAKTVVGPYTRVLYVFTYSNTSFLNRLENEIKCINSAALGISDITSSATDNALSSYKLSRAQHANTALDIITGVQIIDNDLRTFILEGRNDAGMKRLWTNVRRPEGNNPSFKILYNSDITHSSRLYIDFDVEIKRVRLRQNLAEITSEPLIYVRNTIPMACFEGLLRLETLRKLEKLRDITRTNQFPTVAMLHTINKTYGIPATQEDVHGVVHKMNVMPGRGDIMSSSISLSTTDAATSIQRQQKKDSQGTNFMCDALGNAILTGAPRSRNDFSKIRQRIDSTNKNFENLLQIRNNNPTPDFIASNRHQYPAERHERPDYREYLGLEITDDVYNYSTQSKNSAVIAMDSIRYRISRDPNYSYTYSQKFTSMGVSPVTESALKYANELRSEEKSKWKTRNGFSLLRLSEDQSMNRRLPESRIQELRESWKPPPLHELQRNPFPWDQKHLDFMAPYQEKRTQTCVSIHLPGDRQHDELIEARSHEKEIWRQKLVVDDERFHTWRRGNRELRDKVTHQADKREPILKSEPQKLSIRGKFRLEEAPTTSILS